MIGMTAIHAALKDSIAALFLGAPCRFARTGGTLRRNPPHVVARGLLGWRAWADLSDAGRDSRFACGG